MQVADGKVDEFYIAVGGQVRAARESQELSQATLARRIGFTRSSVANLEAGRQRIALHLFILIAKALDVDPVTLLPDTSMLAIFDTPPSSSLEERLAGSPETTHDFVLSTVAKVAQSSSRKEA